MRLTALQYGKTLLPARLSFPAPADESPLPISLLFFLLEIGDRRILIDVGCDTMPGFELIEHQSPVLVLERAGVRREDITDVCLTHTHHDHADGLRHYPRSTVYVHACELAATRPYLVGQSVRTFGDTLSLAKGVTVRHVGGHSPGSSVVLIEGGSETIVLCGDECYTHKNLTDAIPTASSFCPERSRAFITEYRKPIYRPIIFHDPDLVGAIGARVLLEY
jgi:glyoxylase-like metal-dependent hydrolase (beta-lactamase superfamily II)